MSETWMERAYPLKKLSEESYEMALASGMFWEWYPEATGSYEKDCKEEQYPKDYGCGNFF